MGIMKRRLLINSKLQYCLLFSYGQLFNRLKIIKSNEISMYDSVNKLLPVFKKLDKKNEKCERLCNYLGYYIKKSEQNKLNINNKKLFISYVNSLKLHYIYFFQKPNLVSVIRFPINKLKFDTRDFKNKIFILKRDLFSLSKRYEISNKMYQRLKKWLKLLLINDFKLFHEKL